MKRVRLNQLCAFTFCATATAVAVVAFAPAINSSARGAQRLQRRHLIVTVNVFPLMDINEFQGDTTSALTTTSSEPGEMNSRKDAVVSLIIPPESSNVLSNNSPAADGSEISLDAGVVLLFLVPAAAFLAGQYALRVRANTQKKAAQVELELKAKMNELNRLKRQLERTDVLIMSSFSGSLISAATLFLWLGIVDTSGTVATVDSTTSPNAAVLVTEQQQSKLVGEAMQKKPGATASANNDESLDRKDDVAADSLASAKPSLTTVTTKDADQEPPLERIDSQPSPTEVVTTTQTSAQKAADPETKDGDNMAEIKSNAELATIGISLADSAFVVEKVAPLFEPADSQPPLAEATAVVKIDLESPDKEREAVDSIGKKGQKLLLQPPKPASTAQSFMETLITRLHRSKDGSEEVDATATRPESALASYSYFYYESSLSLSSVETLTSKFYNVLKDQDLANNQFTAQVPKEDCSLGTENSVVAIDYVDKADAELETTGFVVLSSETMLVTMLGETVSV